MSVDVIQYTDKALYKIELYSSTWEARQKVRCINIYLRRTQYGNSTIYANLELDTSKDISEVTITFQVLVTTKVRVLLGTRWVSNQR